MSNASNDFMARYEKLKSIFINVIGRDEFKTRMMEYLKSLTKKKKLYRDCDDKLIMYISLSDAYFYNNIMFYDFNEGARIIPLFTNLAKKVDLIFRIKNYEDKMRKICSKRCDNVDSIFFELMVAIKYVELGFDVEFLRETSSKSPDLKIVYDGVESFVECKRLSRANSYAYEEIDRWYVIKEKIANAVKLKKISAEIHFEFKHELCRFSDKRIIEMVISIINSGTKKYWMLENEEIKITFSKIQSEKLALDHAIHHSSPSLIHQLTGRYNPDFLYGAAMSGKGRFPYIEDLDYASIISCDANSEDSSEKKSQQVTHRLAKASKQLKSKKTGFVHFMIEGCNGENTYKKLVEKNYSSVMNFEDRDGVFIATYIHIIKYIVPIDQNFISEETVMYFAKNGFPPLPMRGCYYHYDETIRGHGTLYSDVRI